MFVPTIQGSRSSLTLKSGIVVSSFWYLLSKLSANIKIAYEFIG